MTLENVAQRTLGGIQGDLWGVARWLALAGVVASVSACLDSPPQDDGMKEPVDYGPKNAVSCVEPTPGFDLTGCWISEKCSYLPIDFIQTPGSYDYEPEDYWIRTVYSGQAYAQSFTYVGAPAVTDGRFRFLVVYYNNSSCSGDPVYYGSETDPHYYFKTYANITTPRNQLATVTAWIFTRLYSGDTHENGRRYSTAALTNGRLCFEDETAPVAVASPENQYPDYNQYHTDVNDGPNECYTRLSYDKQPWLTQAPATWPIDNTNLY